jgi:DNA-binding MurR/RpiR family transcriptional regulator
MGELGHLEDNIRPASFKAAVKLLAGAARIHVLAQRRAFPVACYIAYALNQLELRTHLLDGAGGMLNESLRAIAPEDVLVVASFRNYSPEVIAAAAHHARGVPVLAITDGSLSPLKAAANLFRPGRRFVASVPVAGRPALPGAGAGGQHRAPSAESPQEEATSDIKIAAVA